MAEPPDQTNQVVPRDFKWPEPTALDAKAYTPELTPVIDIPPPREATDHTKDVQGYGPGGGGTYQDVLTELSHDDQLRLLAANNIDLKKRNADGLASMRGYSLGKTLTPANEFGILIAKVSCHPEDGNMTTGQSVTYSETVSNIERQTTAAANAGGGVPGIFKFDASFTNSAATAERSRTVRIYFQSSHRIPKALVTIKREDISLDPDLVEMIGKATNEGDAQQLLGVLRDYGHFVPTAIVLGGRTTLFTSTEMDDASTFKSTETKLKAAADARFEVEATPVELGGGAGTRLWDKFEASTVQQAKALHMELKGGLESLGSSQPGTLGGKWIDSVGAFIRWRVIGFAPNSLIPITDFLEPELKEACIALLREYFVGKLRVARTGLAGSEADDLYGPDTATLRRVKRITGFTVDNGENVDGFRWAFDLYGTPSTGSVGYEGDILGRWRGEEDKRKEIKLDPDEHVVSIEACCEPGEGMRRLAIRTNKGRYPDEGFYGRARSATEVKVIQAPRVVGFHGFKATLVHAMGLCYLRLGDDTHSPDFLEKIEPLLFPKRDFGPMGAA